MTACPVCQTHGFECKKTSMASKSEPFAGNRFECSRCGIFILSDPQEGNLTNLSDLQRSVLSHRIRCAQRNNSSPPSIGDNFIPNSDDALPSPADQANRLILWLGDHQLSTATVMPLHDPEIYSWIGTSVAKSYQELARLIRRADTHC
jgi:hypothetical protein